MLWRLTRLGQKTLRAWQSYGPYRPEPEAAPPPQARRLPDSVADTGPLLELMLTQNILPFWFPATVDRELGGYRLDHDIEGAWRGSTQRGLVSQSRTLWFFAALVNAGRGSEAHLAAARHGYDFLRQRMWDPDFGGFYWQVDAVDGAPVMPDKHNYAQAFALYALSEYARASRDPGAEELARAQFRLLQEKARDPEHPGYFEMLARDWASIPVRNYLPAKSDWKTLNTHLHLMEAIERYHRVTGDPQAAEPLSELIQILSRTVIREAEAVSTDLYRRDWTPIAGRRHERVSYGHDLENIWLLAEATESLGGVETPGLSLYRRVFEAAMRHGYDRKRGGFFAWGAIGKPARGRHKVWWIQAEALVAALLMHTLTGERSYADCYLGTLDWVVNYQTDWRHGDWHREIAPNGRPMGFKANNWKTPYHNGRAMLQCLAMLGSEPAEAG